MQSNKIRNWGLLKWNSRTIEENLCAIAPGNNKDQSCLRLVLMLSVKNALKI